MDSKQSPGFELPDAKKLAKLAKSCRTAGISHFKCASFEFTLTPQDPLKVVNAAPKQTNDSSDPTSEDILDAESLLFWSAGGIPVPDANGAS